MLLQDLHGRSARECPGRNVAVHERSCGHDDIVSNGHTRIYPGIRKPDAIADLYAAPLYRGAQTPRVNIGPVSKDLCLDATAEFVSDLHSSSDVDLGVPSHVEKITGPQERAGIKAGATTDQGESIDERLSPDLDALALDPNTLMNQGPGSNEAVANIDDGRGMNEPGRDNSEFHFHRSIN